MVGGAVRVGDANHRPSPAMDAREAALHLVGPDPPGAGAYAGCGSRLAGLRRVAVVVIVGIP